MGYKRVQLSKYKYPGDGYYYVICDVCGCKFRAKDTVKINEKGNFLNGMIVCKRDVEYTNPQQFVKAKREKLISTPAHVRPEKAAVYLENDDDTIAPGAPQFLSIYSVSTDEIELYWLPNGSGSSDLIGYKIERESPVGGGFSTITSNTNSIASYYKDTGLSASTQYNYRVSAVNRNNTSTASNQASATTSAS